MNERMKARARGVIKRIGWGLLIGGAVACANIAGPNGGPYDEKPPRFVSSTPPPLQTNYKGRRVEIVFDELIQVERPSQNVIIAPPQKELPSIQVIGRKIRVELKDTLSGFGFGVFDDAAYIGGICAQGAASYTRKQLDALTDFVKRPQIGAKGMVYARVEADGTVKSSVDKFYSQETLQALASKMQATPGDLILILEEQSPLKRDRTIFDRKRTEQDELRPVRIATQSSDTLAAAAWQPQSVYSSISEAEAQDRPSVSAVPSEAARDAQPQEQPAEDDESQVIRF